MIYRYVRTAETWEELEAWARAARLRWDPEKIHRGPDGLLRGLLAEEDTDAAE